MRIYSVAALAVMVAAACVPSQSRLERPVRDTVRSRAGDAALADDQVAKALLATPLTRDAAVRIALAHNPRVAAALAELGVTAGESAALRSLGRTEVAGSVKFVEGHSATIEVEAIHD